jgi:hypothetical protein
MAKIKMTDVVTKMVDLLTPLSVEERRRAIAASLTLLGDQPSGSEQGAGASNREDAKVLPGPSGRAGVWMKQNNISMDELEQVFSIADGVVEVIASDIPGKDDKEKTYNSYVLVGIARLLATGSPNFDDKLARALCKTSGCLNRSNHSQYLKDKGNEFAGSKDKGWMLTAPGLKRGAALVKVLSKTE